jgi:hypothetical protein
MGRQVLATLPALAKTQEVLAMSTVSRRKENVKAVSGSVKWIKRPSGPTHFGRFAITSNTQRGPVVNEYDVAAFTDDAGRITGFGLAKDSDEVYAVDFSQWYGPTCTCGDCEYRNWECKHIKAVRAAMHEAGITIPAPTKPAPVLSSEVEFDNP